MAQLIDGLLSLARLARTEPHRESVDLTRMVHAVVDQLRASEPSRSVDLVVAEGLVVHGDGPLLRALLENSSATPGSSRANGARHASSLAARKSMVVVRTSCATTARASTWRTSTSYSLPSSGCRQHPSLTEPESVSRRCSASFTATGDACGRRASRTKRPLSASPSTRTYLPKES